MKKGPQAKSVNSKASEQERQLTDSDVFSPLPERVCPCGNKFTPVIAKQKYCSSACFYFYNGVQQAKVMQNE